MDALAEARPPASPSLLPGRRAALAIAAGAASALRVAIQNV